MPGVPSNKACERCKKRHLKCDETRPQCQRCINAGVECPGYLQTRKFIDQGATVRRRYAPYQESHSKTTSNGHETAVSLGDSGVNPSLQYRGSVPVSFAKDATSSEPARQSTLLRASCESEPSTGETSDPNQLGNLLQSPSAVSSSCQSSGRQHTVRPASFPEDHTRAQMPTQSPEVLGNARVEVDLEHPFTHDPIIGWDSQHDRGPPASDISTREADRDDFQNIVSELMTGTEHELAFLTRYFAENLGPWLDLSDAVKFFAVHVPIRAINCVSLKYAMAAFAAKQLGRVKGVKSHTGRGILTSPAASEIYPNSETVDWFLKGVNYYYLSVSDMSKSASDGYSSVSTSVVIDSPIEILKKWLSTQSAKTTGQDLSNGVFLRKVEDILATVAILIYYKLLDTKGETWHTYLAGTHEVFSALMQMKRTDTIPFSHGIQACFWNFARLDYLGSYYIRAKTHLNPSDTSLWRAAGISIDENEKFNIVDTADPYMSKEDQTFNGLCWLAFKVVNFLAHSKQAQVAQWVGSPIARTPSSSGSSRATSVQLSQVPDTNTWLDLCFELQTWFEGVPETIRPCVRIEHPRDLSRRSEDHSSPFPEVVHTMAPCAAAMQHYHFVRIALLLNRPPDVVGGPSTAFDRLQSYREVTKEVDHRCREVCGIALGRPHAEVRINMIPLLFAVGQCLEMDNERQIIVDLLRGIEADLGLATGYAVEKLQSSWHRG